MLANYEVGNIVNEYKELTTQITMLESKKKKLREELIKIFKDTGEKKLLGNKGRVEVTEYKTVEFSEYAKEKIMMKLTAYNKLEYVASLSPKRLLKVINEHEALRRSIFNYLTFTNKYIVRVI